MASIHKDPRGKSPYFYCALTLPNGRRTTRSTKQTDRRKAQAVADSWERTARMARQGMLQDSAARKTISDLYELTNGQSQLPAKLSKAKLPSFVLDLFGVSSERGDGGKGEDDFLGFGTFVIVYGIIPSNPSAY
jgi:hypothetical protein